MASHTESSDRQIVGGVTQNGRLYRAGDEDALAKVLAPHSIARLVEKGELTGDWGTASPSASAPSENAQNAPAASEPTPTAKKRAAKRGRGA